MEHLEHSKRYDFTAGGYGGHCKHPIWGPGAKPLGALAIWLFPGPGIPFSVMVKSCQLKWLIICIHMFPRKKIIIFWWKLHSENMQWTANTNPKYLQISACLTSLTCMCYYYSKALMGQHTKHATQSASSEQQEDTI